jgi:hypothetical protein
VYILIQSKLPFVCQHFFSSPRQFVVLQLPRRPHRLTLLPSASAPETPALPAEKKEPRVAAMCGAKLRAFLEANNLLQTSRPQQRLTMYPFYMSCILKAYFEFTVLNRRRPHCFINDLLKFAESVLLSDKVRRMSLAQSSEVTVFSKHMGATIREVEVF